MGRIFLEHLGGQRVFNCSNCYVPLTNKDEVISDKFTGATGKAILFNRVVNVKFSHAMSRPMMTGNHIVRDVHCKNCNEKLGWMYEYAYVDRESYKEGKIILEKALITENLGPD